MTEVYKRHETDKGSTHSYIEFYERLLEPYRQKPCTLMEIGVAWGGSLKMWRDFLPQAKIIGKGYNNTTSL